MLPAIHDTGTGEAVLFLHAFTLDASQWDHQVAALSGDMRCVRVDLWGCGHRHHLPTGEPTPRRLRRQRCLPPSIRCDIDRVAVVGLSMGGYLAFALVAAGAGADPRARALQHARRLPTPPDARDDRLAMAEQVEREQSVESIVEPMVARMLSPHAQAEAHIVDPVRGRIRRCTPAGIAFAQRAMAARPDSTELLASITVPTLVIAGSQDAIVATHEVRAIADGIPGARYAELDCGHLSNLERPRAVNQQLAEFLVPARMAS